MRIPDLVEGFVNELPQEILDHHIRSSDDELWGQERTFDDEAVEFLANEVQTFIASLIAFLINAGSERDAINEDEELNKALVRVFKDW